MNIKLVCHLKLFSKATVGVCPLLLVVNLVVLHPHCHTSAQTDTRGQTRVASFVPGFRYSSVCSCHNVQNTTDLIILCVFTYVFKQLRVTEAVHIHTHFCDVPVWAS